MKTPCCDKHKNLQMVPFFFEHSARTIRGHVCPVPSCGRFQDAEGYFDMVDGKPARAEKNGKGGVASVREELLKAIRAIAGA
ncbi:MAG TPA: hypothetical protein VJX16_15365 [Terriglobales bacterium]|nr:hypothetical protein [Terriglobales bacterium]